MILKSEKIKNFLSRKKNITFIYIIVIIGVVLISFPSVPERKEAAADETVSGKTAVNGKEIEKILSEICGVGKCKVLITYKNSGEYVTAKDIQKRNGETDEKNLVTGSGRDEKPFIIKEIMPEIRGVVVVCSGGGNTKVKKDVAAAVCALTGIPESRVKVFKNQECD